MRAPSSRGIDGFCTKPLEPSVSVTKKSRSPRARHLSMVPRHRISSSWWAIMETTFTAAPFDWPREVLSHPEFRHQSLIHLHPQAGAVGHGNVAVGHLDVVAAQVVQQRGRRDVELQIQRMHEVGI